MKKRLTNSFDNSSIQDRLLSLDFMRGLIMVLLILESTKLFYYLIKYTQGSFIQDMMLQLEHHPWHGLRFWDTVQPGFMFIAGTALALSLNKQQQKQVPWKDSAKKALKRSGWLFFWGVLDYAVHSSGLSFELWDVLTQLSFTLLVAFLIYNWSLTGQMVFSIGLLLLTELLYRYSNIAGFNQPFTDQQNFGNYVDLVLMNKINDGGWVAINCIPTAAHTIWGMMAGKILLTNHTVSQKIKYLTIPAFSFIIIGYALDFSHITPIIKRIATTSFVFASGGWCLLALVFFYLWIDVLGHKRYTLFFTIVGMNSIFIYLFFEIVGARWFNGYIKSITSGLMQQIVPDSAVNLISCLIIFLLEWGICYFLYKKKLFFKI